MIIDLIDKLLDRLIQLAKERDELNRNIWKDFIEPTFAQFESVHNGYLASFREYKKTVNDAANFDQMVASLAVKVKEDNLFTAGERRKLRALTHGEKRGTSAEQKFAQAIISYVLNVKDDLLADRDPASQYWRNSLLHELREGSWLKEHKDSSAAKKKEVLSQIIDDIVEQLQLSYGDVADQYAALKRSYLDGRVSRLKQAPT
jgi:hypothetical protein